MKKVIYSVAKISSNDTTLLRKLVFIGRNQLKYRARLRLLFNGIKKRARLNSEIRRTKKISAPSVIQVTLTNACNQNCKTCFFRVSNRLNVNVKFLPYEVIKRLVDETCAYGTNFIFAGGGEPTLHPQLGKIVNYITKKGLYCDILTNGFILQDKAKELTEAEIGTVVVSIDGPEEIHDIVRGKKHAYRRALNGIMELNKFQKCPYIAISTTASPITYKFLPKLFKTLEPLIKTGKIKYVMARHMQHFIGRQNLDKHNEKFGENLFYARQNEYPEVDFNSMDIEHLHQIVKWSNRKFPWLIWVGNRMSLEELEKYYRAPNTFIVNKRIYCPWVFVNITETGDVVLCNDVTASNNFIFGNIKEQSFMKIWNTSSKLIKFREILQKYGKLPICARCCSYISARI